MKLDSTDAALIAAAHAGDHTALLALADKKQEEGHEDFAHLLRAGVNHGRVRSGDFKMSGDDPHVSQGWSKKHSTGEGYTDHLWRSVFYLPTTGTVAVEAPTHHPELRGMVERLTGKPAPNGEHWQGTNPLWIETPEQFDALRAYHGSGPTNWTTAVHHGPSGMFTVGELGGRHLVEEALHNGNLLFNDTDYGSAENANRIAAERAGKPQTEPIEETARQYQRSVLSLQTRFGR